MSTVPGRPGNGAVNWDYATTEATLTRLFEHGKRDQWNVTHDVRWDQPVDPESEILSDVGIAIHGSPLWDRLGRRKQLELRMLQLRYTLSQLMHGEQLALVTAAQLVECAPDLEAKLYAATQAVDEARHVEVFSRYLTEKIDASVFPMSSMLRDVVAELIRPPEGDTTRRWTQSCSSASSTAANGRDVGAAASLLRGACQRRRVEVALFAERARHGRAGQAGPLGSSLAATPMWSPVLEVSKGRSRVL